MEPCAKAKEIEGISTRLGDIEEDIDGNGKPGIKGELIMIKDEQRAMSKILSALNTNVSALLIFQAEVTTEGKIREKIKMNTTNVVNIIITAIIGIAAVAVALIVKS
jgi:predicted LPLAT superfamily acyltransferase